MGTNFAITGRKIASKSGNEYEERGNSRGRKWIQGHGVPSLRPTGSRLKTRFSLSPGERRELPERRSSRERSGRREREKEADTNVGNGGEGGGEAVLGSSRRQNEGNRVRSSAPCLFIALNRARLHSEIHFECFGPGLVTYIWR